jgi:hypothetical protein
MGILIRSFALALCLAVVLGAVAGVSATRAASHEISFTNPSDDSSYHDVGSGLTVSWEEGIEPDSRELIEQQASLDVDGGCANVDWQLTDTMTPDQTSLTLTLLPDRCYRWKVKLTVGNDEFSATSGAVRTLKAWANKMNLYRKGVFSTQLRWDWCVAASTQIMFNIIKNQSDHSKAGQKKYYQYARANDLTPDHIPGADPRGWAATLNYYGGGSYTDVSSPTFKSALRAAAKRMRLTGKPVGILARAGDHAMVLNGFKATADPAKTNDFTVTRVWVMGPLYPTDSTYDPPPNTRLDADKFKRRYFKRYSDPFGSAAWSVWEGYFVTINP